MDDIDRTKKPTIYVILIHVHFHDRSHCTELSTHVKLHVTFGLKVCDDRKLVQIFFDIIHRLVFVLWIYISTPTYVFMA
jgi:hypothetical protein